ncbi:hypothetical protein BpHYR1_032716 [Brachionus plicatilis]|uniref:Uncharacterized protein n=1 Tax=Brachionus plicatilis TaxID=10195 RepID=A0A3M7QE24_BRAPC|nr:hypothetical protein BpHYR1_032716 [Brachionus plicatilis]
MHNAECTPSKWRFLKILHILPLDSSKPPQKLPGTVKGTFGRRINYLERQKIHQPGENLGDLEIVSKIDELVEGVVDVAVAAVVDAVL